ncbi:phosphoenolpyruvate synthase, partial [Candidatus Bathyarchaeota archaeon]|nr:phosphoenolpyruvate synthase [Candidatus Bathyarchaeota archaeon]
MLPLDLEKECLIIRTIKLKEKIEVSYLSKLNESKIRSEKLILWFTELYNVDIPLVGGKNANLGEMTQAGIPVPPGFALSAYAYRRFISETGIDEKIYSLIKETITDIKNPELYAEASKKIRKLIESTPIPQDIQDVVKKSYHELGKKTGSDTIFVAVRSSATAEDLPGASFAGQQDTFLNIRGVDELLEMVARCWSSLFTARAMFYRNEKGFRHEDVFISVCVQQMVNSTVAGVMFTVNPVTGHFDQILIEGNWGLGESVVSGSVTPDDFFVDKISMKITDRKIAKKMVEYIRDTKTGKTIHVNVPEERQKQSCLTDQEIIKLAEIAKIIEKHYGGMAQDIEWAIDRDIAFPESIFIVQSRPETVWNEKTKSEIEETRTFVTDRNIVIKGSPASPGIAAGKARIVLSTQEAAKQLEQGNILITEMTTPDWVPYMRIAGAIVTNDGGMTCHAAIVSRELGIPCIVGTENGTDVLKNDF